MARKPSPEQEEAKRLYLDSGGKMPLVEIAVIVGKSDGQIRKWKSEKKWDDELKGNVTESKGNVTKLKSNVTEKNIPEKSAPAPPKEDMERPEQQESVTIGNLGLTDKEEAFVQEYMVDLNATQAAIRAGYSPNSAGQIGYQLLQKPSILTRVREKQDELAAKTDTAQQWVVEKLKGVLERCMQGEPVLDFEGNPTGEWKFDSLGATKSLELIGKHIGMFVDPHRRRIDDQKLQIERSRLQLDQDRLEIERAKAKLDQGDDKEFKVALPPRPEVNQDGD